MMGKETVQLTPICGTILILTYPKREVLKMTFDFDEVVDSFYNLYSRALGFSVQKSDIKRDKNGAVRFRR